MNVRKIHKLEKINVSWNFRKIKSVACLQALSAKWVAILYLNCPCGFCKIWNRIHRRHISFWSSGWRVGGYVRAAPKVLYACVQASPPCLFCRDTQLLWTFWWKTSLEILCIFWPALIVPLRNWFHQYYLLLPID